MGRPAVLRSNEPNPRSGGTVSEYPYDDVSGESAPVDEPVAPEPYVDEPPPPPPPEPPPPPPVEPPPPPPVEEAPPPPVEEPPAEPPPPPVDAEPPPPPPEPPAADETAAEEPAGDQSPVRPGQPGSRESLRRRRRLLSRSPLLRSRAADQSPVQTGQPGFDG